MNFEPNAIGIYGLLVIHCRTKNTRGRSIYITQLDISYSLALVHLIPSWLIWTEIEYTVHVDLPKNTLKPV